MTLRAGSDLSSGSDSAVVARVAPVLPRAALTPRQRQVVAAVATGLMNKEVAYQLGIREDTVKLHLTAIYARTRLSGRVALSRWWLGLDAGPCGAAVTYCDLPAGHDGDHTTVLS